MRRDRDDVATRQYSSFKTPSIWTWLNGIKYSFYLFKKKQQTKKQLKTTSKQATNKQ